MVVDITPFGKYCGVFVSTKGQNFNWSVGPYLVFLEEYTNERLVRINSSFNNLIPLYIRPRKSYLVCESYKGRWSHECIDHFFSSYSPLIKSEIEKDDGVEIYNGTGSVKKVYRFVYE
ncbi:hypothetical protein ACFL1M_04825, partial [Patescibacteria group bacterium]